MIKSLYARENRDIFSFVSIPLVLIPMYDEHRQLLLWTEIAIRYVQEIISKVYFSLFLTLSIAYMYIRRENSKL